MSDKPKSQNGQKSQAKKKPGRAAQRRGGVAKAKGHSKTTEMKLEAFLSLLYEGFSVSKSCETVGIARGLVYQKRSQDQAFADEWDSQIALGAKHRCDQIEDEMWKRAFEGFKEETKNRDGVVVKSVTKVDNGLLVELAKAHMPERFRHNVKVKGEVGPTDELRELIEKVQDSPTSALGSLVR